MSRTKGPSVRLSIVACCAVLGAFAMPFATAASIDWSAVPEKSVTLFYPGQASWEWALTERDHSGGPRFREGRNCAACHEGEEADIGAKIASGEILEPNPVAGKPGSVELIVQTARDADNLHFRFRWKAPAATGHKDDPEFQARITVLLGDEKVREAARAGCWGACHDDVMGMASAPADTRITKYLGTSRARMTRQGGGENFKPDADLATLLNDGVFLDYWQAKLNPGASATPSSGYVLDKRHTHDEVQASAEAAFENGTWTVTLSRPLAGDGDGRKSLMPGTTYAIGFALHEDFSDHRHHYVSLEQSFALEGEADFVARSP
jgi:hypothetical protein